MNDYEREIVNDMRRRKVQLECPSCGSTDITISNAVRKFLAQSNAVIFLVGLVMLAMIFVAIPPIEISPALWRLALVCWTLVCVVLVIGGGALGLPIPILGNMFGRTFEIQCECPGCHHHWSRGFRTEFSK